VKSPSSALIARAVALAAFIVVAATAIYYIFSPVPPYGFYYDLGGNVLATSLIANWMHGFADVWDALGWAGWAQRTAFTYAPMTAYGISVPIAKLFGGNAFAAVKAMQVFDLAAAWASAAYLYVVLRGRSSWAWVAGLVYALLPEQTLMIRGNMEFGLVCALAPLALAAPVALVRRFGLRALPFCGALAGLLSTDLVVEYAVFIGIPACLAAIANAYDRARRWRWLGYSILCFVVFFAVAAYTAIPTVASHALFSPGAPTDALLQGGEFSSYAESPVAIVSLMLNEGLANQRPEFSLGSQLWVVLALGAILWLLAAGWVVRCIRRRSFAPGERVLLIVAAACLLLSMGDAIPGVGLIWWVIAHLPGINQVRTPDRLIALGIPMVVVSAVATLEYLARSVAGRKFAYGGLAVVAVTNLVLFFVLRIFLGDTFTLEEKMPHLDSINAVAQARGNRATNMAFVDTGSIFDTSLYAMMMPNMDFASDFTQRYEGDGLGGTGMLARGNVATIVTSPSWAGDSPLLTQSAVARASFLHPLAGDATSVTAYGVEPVRGYVHPVEPACLDGGPGMLDYIEVLPAFASSAFVPNGRDCTRTLYTDSAPASELLGGRIVASFAGTAIFANVGVLRDIDYRVALGRFLLNNPWYRNSIDGDSPQLSDGAVSLDPGKTGGGAFTLASPGAYAVALRAVCHGTIHGTIAVDNGPAKPFVCTATRGFSWATVPVGRLDAGTHRFAVTVGDFDTSTPLADTTWHFGVDGAVVVARGEAAERPQPSGSAFAFSVSRLDADLAHRPNPELALASTTGFEALPGAPDPSRTMLLARSSEAIAKYRFTGLPGRYRIAATAYADGSLLGGSYLGILDGARCCVAVSSLNHDFGPELYAEGTLRLRPGDSIGVVLHTAANDPNAISQLLSVSIESDPKPVVPDESRSRYVAFYDYVAKSKKYNPVVPAGPTPVPGHAAITPYFGLALWTKPATLTASGFPASTQTVPTTFSADFAGGGSALVRLSCGADSITARLVQPGGSVTLPQSTSPDCTVEIASQDSGFYLKQAAIARAIVDIDLHATRWMAAGTYVVEPIERGGNVAGGNVIVDGRPVVRSLVRIARDGFHQLRWLHAPADAFMIAFVPAAWPQSAPAVAVTQDSSQRWTVHLDRTASLEGAVLSDGNWRLTSPARSISGTSCDLENTCFNAVPPGDYHLWHAWPGYILVGFAITLLAWFGAGSLLVLTARRT
jgi:hypothetical protein